MDKPDGFVVYDRAHNTFAIGRNSYGFTEREKCARIFSTAASAKALITKIRKHEARLGFNPRTDLREVALKENPYNRDLAVIPVKVMLAFENAIEHNIPL